MVVMGRRRSDGGGGGGGAGAFGVFATAAADGDVTEGAAVDPVATKGFAEVARLGEVVVVVVTELGVGGVAARTWEMLLFRRRSRSLRRSGSLADVGWHE